MSSRLIQVASPKVIVSYQRSLTSGAAVDRAVAWISWRTTKKSCGRLSYISSSMVNESMRMAAGGGRLLLGTYPTRLERHVSGWRLQSAVRPAKRCSVPTTIPMAFAACTSAMTLLGPWLPRLASTATSLYSTPNHSC